jgi:hypothetical protein
LFNASNMIVGSNSGWGGDPQLAAAANAVYAFPFTNPSSHDSAILVTLQPGSYTTQTASVTGVAGVVMIETYEVP